MKRAREESVVEGRPSASILTIPMGVGVVFVNLVVRHLDWKDILHLSMTCKRLYEGDVSVYPDAIRKKYDGRCPAALYLQGRRLSVAPNKMVFSTLNTIRNLYLWGYSLPLLRDHLFGNLSNLQKLHLSFNQLTPLPGGLFQGLTNLQVLGLDHNQLTSLPAGLFQGLTNLQKLSLDNNQLASLPAGVFQGLTKLAVLYLSGNKLSSLPTGLFRGLTNLRYLTLRRNHLTPDTLSNTRAELPKCAIYTQPNL